MVKYRIDHFDHYGNPGFRRNGIMGRVGAIISIILLVALILVALSGCNNSAPPPATGFLIKAGSVRVFKTEFGQELDLKLTAYPYDIRTRPDEYNTMVLDLVYTLSEETVLLAAAKAKAIDVSSAELALAEQKFKRDYPEDSFDQMLLENALPYTVWKNRFKKDKVIERLIQQDLVAVQEITPEDMVNFYNGLDRGEDSQRDQTPDEIGLVEQLRMEKSQTSYDKWIQGLKSLYPLEIDNNAVAVFLMTRE